MSEFFWIYLYTVAHSVANWAFMFIVIMCIFGVVVGVIYFISAVEDFDAKSTIEHATKRHLRLGTIAIFIALSISSIVPNDDEVKTIIGGGLAWKATQVEGVSDLPENLVRVMNQFLESTAPESTDQSK